MTSTALSNASSVEASTMLWTFVADELDIPPSLYARAADRHTSLGEWLRRPESSLAQFRPKVHPQGSFRYGTVIKPLVEGTAYDLDQVVVFEGLRADQLSQAELKVRFGAELAAYARAHQMLPPEEKHRCWRLNYRDEVPFHLDSLPSVPANADFLASLRASGVAESWVLRAIAITDDRHLRYRLVTSDWLTSNPRGFARWFEAQAARGRGDETYRAARVAVEDVPPYEWRTPLQRSIQILKRHRDVMFRQRPELAPISMIITNLAAHAYGGERDLSTALRAVVERMGGFVRNGWPKVPNPTHPQEDYADKWRAKPELETSFWTWLEQARATVRALTDSPDLRYVAQHLQVSPTAEFERRMAMRASSVKVASLAIPHIHDAPRPWGQHRSGGRS